MYVKRNKLFMFNQENILIVFLIIQVLSFLLYTYDKYKAIRGHSRISEKTLLLSTFIAPLGALLGIYLVRHKTKKISFLIFAWPLILISSFIYYKLLFENSLLY